MWSNRNSCWSHWVAEYHQCCAWSRCKPFGHNKNVTNVKLKPAKNTVKIQLMPVIDTPCSFFTLWWWIHEAETEASKRPNHCYSSVDCTSAFSPILCVFVRRHMLRTRSSGVNCPLIAPPLLNYTFQSGRLRLQHAAVWAVQSGKQLIPKCLAALISAREIKAST